MVVNDTHASALSPSVSASGSSVSGKKNLYLLPSPLVRVDRVGVQMAAVVSLLAWDRYDDKVMPATLVAPLVST